MKFLYYSMLWVVGFSSCGPNVVFDNTVHLENNQWPIENKLAFDVNIIDTLSFHNFYVNLRHTSDYPYSNLWVFINTTAPGGGVYKDTVECILAGPEGNWLGKSATGSLWSTTDQIMYKRKIRFPKSGMYQFNMIQAMRTNPLEGLSDVGLRIEKESN